MVTRRCWARTRQWTLGFDVLGVCFNVQVFMISPVATAKNGLRTPYRGDAKWTGKTQVWPIGSQLGAAGPLGGYFRPREKSSLILVLGSCPSEVQGPAAALPFVGRGISRTHGASTPAGAAGTGRKRGADRGAGELAFDRRFGRVTSRRSDSRRSRRKLHVGRFPNSSKMTRSILGSCLTPSAVARVMVERESAPLRLFRAAPKNSWRGRGHPESNATRT